MYHELTPHSNQLCIRRTDMHVSFKMSACIIPRRCYENIIRGIEILQSILWHIRSKQELWSQQPAVTRQLPVNFNRRIVFSAQSVPMAAHVTMDYVMASLNNNYIATEERCFLRGPCRELLGFNRCELLLLEAGGWGRERSGTQEKGERPPLEAAAKQQQWRRDCGQ
jgi:hypothetical protein